jgi:hypothetical protein
MYRRGGIARDPYISIENHSISKLNGGVLYVGNSEIEYHQASGAFILTRNS